MTYQQVNPVSLGQPGKTSNLGRIALVLVIACAAISIAGSLWLGLTIAPMEAKFGPTLLETPDPYRSLALTVLVIQVLCAFGGVTALILGAISVGRRVQAKVSVTALIISVIAPCSFLCDFYARPAVCRRVIADLAAS